MNRVKLFLFSFFLLCSFQISAGEKRIPPYTLLDQAVAKGNIHAFRIEIEKLLNDPASDFFQSMAVYMRDGGGFDQHIQRISSRDFSSVDPETLKQFLLENTVLSVALSLPLGKKNSDNQSAKHSALFSDNMPVYFLLQEYNNELIHELYGEGAMNVWSRLFYLSTDIKNIPWYNLPRIHLPDTPSVRALLNGDLKAFQKSWQDLLKGPARDLFALLHSTGKNGETFFHYAAEFRPKRLQGIDREDLTPEQERELNNSQEVIAGHLTELLELFPSAVKNGGVISETIKSVEFPRLSEKKKRYIWSMGVIGLIGGVTAVSNESELIALLGGVVSVVAIERAVECYNSFKKAQSEKSKSKE